MYLIRDVLKCKPGRAKDLVNIMKRAEPHIAATGLKNLRIMTDAVSTFWTVVLELEVESLETFWDAFAKSRQNPALNEIMAGYMDCLEGGQREVFKIE